jgi:hypothetical protein
MSEVLVWDDDAEPESAVADVAQAVAEVLQARVRNLFSGDRPDDEKVARLVLREMQAPTVVLSVLARDARARSIWPRVVKEAAKPVIVVPPAVSRPVISRVLVPLDGTAEASLAVGETVALFAGGDVDVVVLHTFDASTAPRFWDQAAHAQQEWEGEFLARFCALPGARLELRSGTPGQQVIDVAVAEHVDLITLGWSQQLDAGRAGTVRQTLLDAVAPVMLIPVRLGEVRWVQQDRRSAKS